MTKNVWDIVRTASDARYKFLNLSGNPLCAEGVKALASGLPYVTSLKVPYCSVTCRTT